MPEITINLLSFAVGAVFGAMALFIILIVLNRSTG